MKDQLLAKRASESKLIEELEDDEIQRVVKETIRQQETAGKEELDFRDRACGGFKHYETLIQRMINLENDMDSKEEVILCLNTTKEQVKMQLERIGQQLENTRQAMNEMRKII